jgi:NAD(P)-dependent dehydrogenase (short-subunit alcohol dehydrogenase family)
MLISLCRALVEFAIKKFDTLDLLVLNAGLACHQRFEDTDMSVFHTLMQTNYFGYVYCTKHALPYLRHTRGTIAVIGSVSGELGFPLRTAYCASKFAVTGFFEALQAELGDQLQITIVQPAFVNTHIRDHALGPRGDDIEHSETKRMSVEVRTAFFVGYF